MHQRKLYIAVQFFVHFYSMQWPEYILYVRDGVSEGEQSKVLEQEVQTIERAYATRRLEKPKLTVVICTKRIKTRFFVEHQTDPRLNVPPGLVVFDDLLSHDDRYQNFYMVSHAGASRS